MKRLFNKVVELTDTNVLNISEEHNVQFQFVYNGNTEYTEINLLNAPSFSHTFNPDAGELLIKAADTTVGSNSFDIEIVSGTETYTYSFDLEVLSGDPSPTLNTIDESDLKINQNEYFNIKLSGSDPNDENLSYDYRSDEIDDAILNSSTGEFYWTPDSSIDNEIFNVTFIVENESGLQDEKTFALEVGTVDYHRLTISTSGTHLGYTEPQTKFYKDGEIADISAYSITGAFNEWSGSTEIVDVKSDTTQITMTQNEYIDAEFLEQQEVDTYTLDTSVTGSGSITVDPEKEEYNSGETVTLTAVPDQYYILDSWSTGETADEITVTMDSNKTIQADFTVEQIEIDITQPDNGTITIDPDQETYDINSTVNLTASADTGYEFDSWTGDNLTEEQKANSSIDVLADEASSITASFKKKSYSLNTNVDGNGSIDITPDQTSYLYQEEATLTAVADEHSVFDSWSTGETEETITITFDSDKDITANFKTTVSLSEPENGNITITPDQETYEPNSEVTLSAEPENGYEFKYWIGDMLDPSEVENPDLIVTVEDASQITAEFIAQELDCDLYFTNPTPNQRYRVMVGDTFKTKIQAEYTCGSNDLIEYEVTEKPETATFDPETQIFEWSPTEEDIGRNEVKVCASVEDTLIVCAFIPCGNVPEVIHSDYTASGSYEDISYDHNGSYIIEEDEIHIYGPGGKEETIYHSNSLKFIDIDSYCGYTYALDENNYVHVYNTRYSYWWTRSDYKIDKFTIPDTIDVIEAQPNGLLMGTSNGIYNYYTPDQVYSRVTSKASTFLFRGVNHIYSIDDDQNVDIFDTNFSKLKTFDGDYNSVTEFLGERKTRVAFTNKDQIHVLNSPVDKTIKHSINKPSYEHQDITSIQATLDDIYLVYGNTADIYKADDIINDSSAEPYKSIYDQHGIGDMRTGYLQRRLKSYTGSIETISSGGGYSSYEEPEYTGGGIYREYEFDGPGSIYIGDKGPVVSSSLPDYAYIDGDYIYIDPPEGYIGSDWCQICFELNLEMKSCMSFYIDVYMPEKKLRVYHFRTKMANIHTDLNELTTKNELDKSVLRKFTTKNFNHISDVNSFTTKSIPENIHSDIRSFTTKEVNSYSDTNDFTTKLKPVHSGLRSFTTKELNTYTSENEFTTKKEQESTHSGIRSFTTKEAIEPSQSSLRSFTTKQVSNFSDKSEFTTKLKPISSDLRSFTTKQVNSFSDSFEFTTKQKPVYSTLKYFVTKEEIKPEQSSLRSFTTKNVTDYSETGSVMTKLKPDYSEARSFTTKNIGDYSEPGEVTTKLEPDYSTINYFTTKNVNDYSEPGEVTTKIMPDYSGANSFMTKNIFNYSDSGEFVTKNVKDHSGLSAFTTKEFIEYTEVEEFMTKYKPENVHSGLRAFTTKEVIDYTDPLEFTTKEELFTSEVYEFTTKEASVLGDFMTKAVHSYTEPNEFMTKNKIFSNYSRRKDFTTKDVE